MDALDSVPERVPEVPDGGGDGERAATVTDEPVETQASEPVTGGQPDGPNGPPAKSKTRRDRTARASRRPEDISA
jgi:hypothetical protein